MRFRKSWLYYQILAFAALYLRPADANVIAWKSYGTPGSQDEYNTCFDKLSGDYCTDDPGEENIRALCRRILSDIDEGCPENDRGDLYNILEFTGTTFYCEGSTYDSAKIHRLHSCNACYPRGGGYEKRVVELQDLCGNHSWAWENAEMDVEEILDWVSDPSAAQCGDDEVPRGLTVCVECGSTLVGMTGWSTDPDNNLRVKRGRTYSMCGTNETTYEYACKGNTYRYGPNISTSALVCNNCPAQHASCNQFDGHWDPLSCISPTEPNVPGSDGTATACIFTWCPKGQYLSSGECIDCVAGTYQPVYGNSYGAASCIPCPNVCGFPSTTASAGTTDAIGNCCISAAEQHEEAGVGWFHFAQDFCYTGS